jgi:DNA polymerase I-like protein with 3'-5' exonuclease and polymerase domains
MSSDIVFDIEADGLNPTQIFCVVAEKDGELFEFTNRDEFAAFVEENEGNDFYAHNGTSYDYPVLSRLWDIVIPERHRWDTLVLSRLASPSRDGGHALKSWGVRLGFPKGEHYEFDRFSPELLEYCRQDVRVTRRVLDEVNRELEGFDRRAVQLEHDVARIIFQQEVNGWKLDERRCFELVAELVEKKHELEEAVHHRFRPRCKAVRTVIPKKTKAGAWALPQIKCLGENAVRVVGGSFTLVDWPTFNLGSRKQIGEYLQMFGWKPTQFTETGQPVVSEKALARVKGIPEASLIADYLTVEKRIGMAQSWLDLVGSDGRVHGRVNSNGAVTGRMTHYSPNMAQVTSGSKIYGKEMRQCWICEEGYSIVGMDADGLELRMLAHYMDDPDYVKTVSEGSKDDGTDVHTSNMRAAGLSTRDQAKTFIYAFLYGAGDEKIGSIIGGSRREGKEIKAKFLRRTPALARLKDRVERASARGWLKGLDGRRIQVRSTHAALNTLLQGAGAVVMKQALVRLDTMAGAHKLDYRMVGNIHDEIQTEVLASQAEKFGQLACYAVARAGKDLGLRCPTAGTFQVGKTWAETH